MALSSVLYEIWIKIISKLLPRESQIGYSYIKLSNLEIRCDVRMLLQTHAVPIRVNFKRTHISERVCTLHSCLHEVHNLLEVSLHLISTLDKAMLLMIDESCLFQSATSI